MNLYIQSSVQFNHYHDKSCYNMYHRERKMIFRTNFALFGNFAHLQDVRSRSRNSRMSPIRSVETSRPQAVTMTLNRASGGV